LFVLKQSNRFVARVDIPEREYDCQALLPATSFVAVCNELKDVGEQMLISINSRSIEFAGCYCCCSAVVVVVGCEFIKEHTFNSWKQ
jgi:hypothetical protein